MKQQRLCTKNKLEKRKTIAIFSEEEEKKQDDI